MKRKQQSLIQVSILPGRDLNPRPPEKQAGIATIRHEVRWHQTSAAVVVLPWRQLLCWCQLDYGRKVRQSSSVWEQRWRHWEQT